MSKTYEMTYEKALAMGGKDWQGKRVYFNEDSQKAAIYGVEIKGKDGYKNGEKISRTNLTKIVCSRPWFDIEEGVIYGLVTTFHRCGGYASIDD